jgi:hypothetical protein
MAKSNDDTVTGNGQSADTSVSASSPETPPSGAGAALPAFSFDMPSFGAPVAPGSSGSVPPQLGSADAAAPPSSGGEPATAAFGGLPPLFGEAPLSSGAPGESEVPGHSAFGSDSAERPATAAAGAVADALASPGGFVTPETASARAASEQPASSESQATATGAAIPAHLQLPAFDFSLPPLPAGAADGTTLGPFSGAGSASNAPLAADLPAHLQLPTFPQFDLPPIPGETPAREAPPSPESQPAPGATPASAPPPLRQPPPPPRRRASSGNSAARANPELPLLALPSLGAEPKKKDVTLLASEAAKELAELPPRKRPVIAFFAIAVLVVGGAAAWVKRDAIVVELASKEPHPVVVETAEDKALARFAAGQEAYNHNRLNEAVKSFEAALALMPNSAKVHRALAIARAKQNRAADAVEHYRAYLELDPRAADAAQVRKIIDDYEKAKATAAAKAAEEKPKHRRR